MQRFKFLFLFLFITLLIYKNNNCNPLFAQDKTHIDSLLKRANYYFNSNNFDSAKTIYENVLEIDQNNIEALLGHAKNGYHQIDLLDILSNKNYSYAKNREKNRSNIPREKFSKALWNTETVLKIDPNNIEANYLLGILYREKIRLRLSFDNEGSFEHGVKCFNKVLQLDNSYKDTYVQLALLYGFYEKYQDALDTCSKAIEINPGYSPAYQAYIRIANDFFRAEIEKEEIEKYLNDETDIFKRYLRGEFARINGETDEAMSIFRNILRNYEYTPQYYINYKNFPITLIYSSLIKIYAKENLTNEINQTFWLAVSNIRNNIEADIIFNDIKYLATDSELRKYFSISLDEKKASFFSTFWNKRHPETSMNYSGRLAEHFKRLLQAEKEFHAKRDRVLFKNPENSYEINYEYSDQGLIYIKHGEPDKKNITSSYSSEESNMEYGVSKQFMSDTTNALSNALSRSKDDSLIYQGAINEAWLYNESPYNKKMIFCFIGFEKKLISNFFDKEILKDIKHWDSNFFRYINSYNDLDEDDMVQKIVKDGQEQLAVGVSSERSSIRQSSKEIILPNEIYKMKGPNGKTHMKIAYFMPVEYLMKEIPSNIDTLLIENGYMILNKDWSIEAAKSDTLFVPRGNEKSYSQVKFLFVDVEPDSSEINLFFNPINSNISCFYKSRTIIENFSTPGLKLSDIVIASKLEKSDKKGFFTRNGMEVIPSPTSKYPIDKLLNIYYEIYGLKKNSEGKTLYNVEYSFKYSGKDENLLKKLFSSSDKQSISTEYSKSGNETTSNEYISFDLGKLKEGFYDLEVTIRDVNSQAVVKKTKKIELYD